VGICQSQTGRDRRYNFSVRRTALCLAAALCVGTSCARYRCPAPPPTTTPAEPRGDDPAATELALVEGAPQIAEGVEWTLVGASYAHLSEDRNRSQVKLQARRGGETIELRVSRIHPGEASFTPAWDLEVGLKHASAYNPPVSAVLLLRPAAAP
jgi:hypothetical protein